MCEGEGRGSVQVPRNGDLAPKEAEAAQKAEQKKVDEAEQLNEVPPNPFQPLPPPASSCSLPSRLCTLALVCRRKSRRRSSSSPRSYFLYHISSTYATSHAFVNTKLTRAPL